MPWRRDRLPTSLFLPGEFQGQRSLTGYSPWAHKESDMTERLTPLPPPHGYFGVLSHTLFPLHISTRTTINIYLYVSLTVLKINIYTCSFQIGRQWHPTPVLLPEKIPRTEEPGRLPSMGSHRVGHDWSDLAAAAAAFRLKFVPIRN